MKAARQPATTTAETGEDYRIIYRRGDGYSLEFQGQYCGSFDRLQDARDARNELAFDQLRRTN